jgi:Effector-associated domain 1
MTALTGKQRTDLVAALKDSVQDYDELEMFLSLQLDKKLADIWPKAPMPLVVFKVVTDAETKGWLSELVQKAVAVYDTNAGLRAFSGIVPAPGFRPSAGDLVTQFDLQRIEVAFRTARVSATHDALVPVAIAFSEPTFEHCLIERLLTVVATRVSRRASLGGAAFPVARVIEMLAPVKPSLASYSGLFFVAADQNADAPLIDDFWSAFRDEFRGAANEVVLLLSVPSEDVVPAGVTRLPTPTWEAGDIDLWISAIAQTQNWTANQVTHLSRATWKLLEETSAEARATVLYDELRNIVADLQADPLTLLGRLPAA